MTNITHIRVIKADKNRLKRFAKKKGLTSSQAFKIVLGRAGL